MRGPARPCSISFSQSVTTRPVKLVLSAGSADDSALGRALDPAEATGSPAEVALAFRDAYRMLHQRIAIFTALPIRSLDQLSLQAKLREIGRMEARPRRRLSQPDAIDFAADHGGEALGSAFLLATVVGSGIMGQRLAGGNVALVLLGNTLPNRCDPDRADPHIRTGIRAHFNPVLSLAFALRGETTWRMFTGYVAAQLAGADRRVARTPDVRSPVRQFSTTVRSGRASGGGGHRCLWAIADCLLYRQCPRRDRLCRRALHHCRLLVHGLYLIRKSCRDVGAVTVRHLRSECPERRPCFCHRPNHRGLDRDCACAMALAEHPLALDAIIPRTNYEAQKVAPKRHHFSTKSLHF